MRQMLSSNDLTRKHSLRRRSFKLKRICNDERTGGGSKTVNSRDFNLFVSCHTKKSVTLVANTIEEVVIIIPMNMEIAV